MRKQVLLSTLTIVLLLSLVTLAYCTTQTFSVPKLTEYTTTLSFNQNDYISGSIVVAGGVSNAINFYITDPKGNNVVSHNDVTQVSFSFTASTTGNYTVYFDNRDGLFAKSVTFNCSDKTAVLGLPQDTFILLLAIIIVIIVVVIAVLLLLRRRPKETPKTP
jgi:hypothetical protein